MPGTVILLQVAADMLTVLQGAGSPVADEQFQSASQLEEILSQLQRDAGAVDAIVLGELLDSPVRLAERIRLLDKDLALFILSRPAQHEAIKQAARGSPLVGSKALCLASSDSATLATALRQSLAQTRQRRRHHAVLQISQTQLAATAVAQDYGLHYLDRLLDHAPIGIVLVDTEQKVLAVNRYTLGLLNAGESEMIGASLVELFPASEHPALFELIRLSLELRQETRRDPAPCAGLQILAKDQNVRVVETTATSLRLPNHSRGVLLILQDITDRRRIEERNRQLQQEIISVQAKMLRDLSTPLIPISDEVVVLPLIGTLDRQRMRDLMDVLLPGLTSTQARMAIFDVTGVPTLDAEAAQGLIAVARAAKLLGVEVILTGIRPEVARQLVVLGIELQGIATRSTLQRGVAEVIRKLAHSRAVSRLGP